MKMISIICPNCGATFQGDAESDQVCCEYCGYPLFINDIFPNNTSNDAINNSPDNKSNNDSAASSAGDLGRQAGQALGQLLYQTNNSGNKSGYWSNPNNQYNQTHSNNTIWVWALGWIFIFPVPLTILAKRTDKLSKEWKIGIISTAWLVWLFFTLIVNGGKLFGGSNNKIAEEKTAEVVTEEVASNDTVTKEMPSEEDTEELLKSNILNISFNDTDIEVEEGKTSSEMYIQVEVNDTKLFTDDDIIFVSEDTDIADISFSKSVRSQKIYYKVIGYIPGETTVYAKTKDGEVESNRVKVVVKDDGFPDPETITIVSDVSVIAIGEGCQLSIETTPADATYRDIAWTSSDNSVITVDEKGYAKAMNGGDATITATVLDDIVATYDLSVDASKKNFSIKIDRSRDDNNNIGDEWSFTNKVNDETGVKSISLAIGEKVNVSSTYTEDDSRPDVGNGSGSHVVTEEDLNNGFEISYDVYVQENGGKNSGKNAHFLVTYTFTPQ